MPDSAAPAPPAAPSPDGGGQIAAELLKNDFAWSLGVIMRRYLRAADEIVGDVPGGPRGYQVIASASQHLATNQGAMAAQLGIDRTVLTYLIDDLEAAGLVERQPDPADRRSRRVVATEAGETLWRERHAALARVEAEILGVLGQDQAAFKELLQQVALHADQLDPMHNACQVVEELQEPDQGTRRRRRRG
ncbi:MarR family winged helix-turn-helix transcriptional regulator [Plantactinospora sp. WMMB334]|uniref:MarR family winged helix-turn-helix transcriptional regulator n=1 Tax=Plantactinospora sp. WMMB334 TaxID=3404119 RepID=UPI003B92E71A